MKQKKCHPVTNWYFYNSKY